MVACRRLLKAGLSDDTERYNAELMLGDALNTLGKSAEAVDAYNAAIEIDPKFYSAYYGLGLVRLNAGRYAEARAALDKAVALNPKDANSLYQRGTALADLGDFAAGRADVEKAIELNAGDTSYYEQLAVIHLAEGDPDAALAAVEQATKVDPGLLGFDGMITHYLAGAFDRTKAMAAVAIKDVPDYPYTYIWKALAQKAAGDNAAAVASLDAGKKAVGKTDWPVPVMDYLAGRIPESKLRSLAQSNDAKTEAERLCEVNFYIGEAAHLAGDQAAAKAALQAAVDTRIYHYLELAAAKARAGAAAIAAGSGSGRFLSIIKSGSKAPPDMAIFGYGNPPVYPDGAEAANRGAAPDAAAHVPGQAAVRCRRPPCHRRATAPGSHRCAGPRVARDRLQHAAPVSPPRACCARSWCSRGAPTSTPTPPTITTSSSKRTAISRTSRVIPSLWRACRSPLRAPASSASRSSSGSPATRNGSPFRL